MVQGLHANAGVVGSASGPEEGRKVEKVPGEGNGNSLQQSCLENPMDRGASGATVHGTAKSQTQLSMHTRHVTICNT